MSKSRRAESSKKRSLASRSSWRLVKEAVAGSTMDRLGSTDCGCGVGRRRPPMEEMGFWLGGKVRWSSEVAGQTLALSGWLVEGWWVGLLGAG